MSKQGTLLAAEMMMASLMVDTVMMSDRVNAALAASVDWVTALDRSRLGSLAAPRECLVIQQAHERVAMEGFRRMEEALDAQNYFSGHLDEYTKFHDLPWIMGESYDRLTAEVHLWWLLSNETPLIDYANTNHSHITPSVILWVERLNNAYNRPSLLPFFEAGIWDVEFIEHCIAEDIDVAMAVDMAVA